MILTLGYNQLIIFATMIIGYFLRNSVLSDTLLDIKNRFSFVKNLKFEDNKKTQQRSNNQNNQHIQNHNDQFIDIQPYSRKKNEFQKWSCSIKSGKPKHDIAKPTGFIPYNFTNNKNNNVLFNINPDHTKSRLDFEKELIGDIATSNNGLLHTNYDKNISSYKIFNKIDTIINTEDTRFNKFKKNICIVKNPIDLPKKINLLSRIKDEKIVTNWNIPLLPENYITGKHILYMSKTYHGEKFNIFKSSVYEVPIEVLPCNLELENLGIIAYQNKNEINLFLETPVKDYLTQEEEDSIRQQKLDEQVDETTIPQINFKVVYKFKYYNNLKQLKQCYLESNLSSIKLI